MKENDSFAKKAITVVAHQCGLVVAVLCAFAGDYWIKQSAKGEAALFWCLGIIGIIVAFVMIAGLTNATLSSQAIDKVGADVQITVMLILLGLALYALGGDLKSFSLQDLLVTVGVFSYLLDAVFLAVYCSLLRQLRQGILWRNCLIARLIRYCSEELFQKTMLARAIRGLVAWLIALLGAYLWFARGFCWGGILILLSGAIELFFSLRKASEEKRIRKRILSITEGQLDEQLDPESFHGEQRYTAEAVNHIRDGLKRAVQEEIKNERMKADLITNVSHDLKTPLTSIINYTEIIRRELPDVDETVAGHLQVLDEKSHRLKSLMEDLVEVSRLTSGTVQYEIARIDLLELMYEMGGEFDDRFEVRGLTIVTKLPRLPVYIEADGRQLFRAIENLYTNAAKYARENTSVSVELKKEGEDAVLSISNIIAEPFTDKLDPEKDLTERFVRGDKSRATEGSGLGLSITKELVTQMGGSFSIHVNDETYIALIRFKMP